MRSEHHPTLQDRRAAVQAGNAASPGLAALGAAAAAPAVLTLAEQDEARELGSGAGFSGQGTADTRDCAQADADRKYFTTLAARAAMTGCTLHELACGGFLLCRWGMAKELPDLRAVAAMLGRMGAPA